MHLSICEVKQSSEIPHSTRHVRDDSKYGWSWSSDRAVPRHFRALHRLRGLGHNRGGKCASWAALTRDHPDPVLPRHWYLSSAFRYRTLRSTVQQGSWGERQLGDDASSDYLAGPGEYRTVYGMRRTYPSMSDERPPPASEIWIPYC